jgi:hypothetical protein
MIERINSSRGNLTRPHCPYSCNGFRSFRYLTAGKAQ